jgi:hypothetical protein
VPYTIRNIFGGRLYHYWRAVCDHAALHRLAATAEAGPQLQEPSQVAVLFIGTHLYIHFFPRYYQTFKTFLLPSTPKTFFVFTDMVEESYLYNQPDIAVIPVQHWQFPLVNLMKFHFINTALEPLRRFSHIMYIDADTYGVAPILEREFFSHDKPLFAVRHYNFLTFAGPQPFERNPQSLAAIRAGDDVSTYWQSCFWGGTSAAFLQATHVLAERTQRDLEKNIMAIWWDESFLNKYFIDHKPLVHTCAPMYSWPATKPVPKGVEIKIMHVAENPPDAGNIPSIKKSVRRHRLTTLTPRGQGGHETVSPWRL